MVRIKLCGLSRVCDIEAVNELKPEYIGFVFAEKSKRYVSPEKAMELKQLLHQDIMAVGVFVDERPEVVGELLNENCIDMAQLHGEEDEKYIEKLHRLTKKPIIKAFCIDSENDIKKAEHSVADYILFDSGAGTGIVFDWDLLKNVNRPYFLAGGLGLANVKQAVRMLNPYAVDVSSGIETNGVKDQMKMKVFAEMVRAERNIG